MQVEQELLALFRPAKHNFTEQELPALFRLAKHNFTGLELRIVQGQQI